jgi:divalent metal cation (Fe/Co/Zn/Cd) transporter
MITWISFAVLGFLLGIYLTVVGFVIFMVIVLALYGGATSVLQEVAIRDLVIALFIAAVALQIGYFVCVVLRIVIRRLRSRTPLTQSAPMEVSPDRNSRKDEGSLRSWAGWFIRHPTERR